MNKKAIITSIVISLTVSLLFGGLLIGAGALVIFFPTIIDVVINAAFALIGLSLILTTIPNLIVGIVNFKQKKAKSDLIFSVITIVVGVILGIHGLTSVLLAIGLKVLMMPALVNIVRIGMAVLQYALCGIVALYLILLPLIRILKAENKWTQFKLEMIKMIFGALIVVLLICGLLATVLGRVIGLFLIAIGVLTVLLALANFSVGLIGIKKADKKSAVKLEMDLDGDGVADAVISKDE